MGSVTKKLQKRIALGKDYNNKYLTEEEYTRLCKSAAEEAYQRLRKDIYEQEYERLRDEVMETVANKMMTDTLCVVMNILDKYWGRLHIRDTRFKVFGALFKPMLKEQSLSHSKEYLDKIMEGGLAEVDYGTE